MEPGRSIYTEVQEMEGLDYRIHSGIVLQEICGRYFLMAFRPAWDDCSRIQELNEYGAFCWGCLEQGLSIGEMIDEITKRYHVHEKEAGEGLMGFLDQLRNGNYLILADAHS